MILFKKTKKHNTS